MAIHKHDRGFELWATKKQIQVVVRAGLEPATAGLQVRHADHSTTLPPGNIQLFQERSYKQGNAYATTSQVINMGNAGFYCCLIMVINASVAVTLLEQTPEKI